MSLLVLKEDKKHFWVTKSGFKDVECEFLGLFLSDNSALN